MPFPCFPVLRFRFPPAFSITPLRAVLGWFAQSLQLLSLVARCHQRAPARLSALCGSHSFERRQPIAALCALIDPSRLSAGYDVIAMTSRVWDVTSWSSACIPLSSWRHRRSFAVERTRCENFCENLWKLTAMRHGPYTAASFLCVIVTAVVVIIFIIIAVFVKRSQAVVLEVLCITELASQWRPTDGGIIGSL